MLIVQQQRDLDIREDKQIIIYSKWESNKDKEKRRKEKRKTHNKRSYCVMGSVMLGGDNVEWYLNLTLSSLINIVPISN